MLIAAPFTVARTWTQPQCPSTEEWMKMWYMHTVGYFSATERNETALSAERGMDPETSQGSQKEKSKYRLLMHTCGI